MQILLCWVLDISFYSFKYFWSLFLIAVKLLENTLILWDLHSLKQNQEGTHVFFFAQEQINLQPRANLPRLLGNILWILSLIPLCFMKFYGFGWLEVLQVNCSTSCFPLFFFTVVLDSLLTCMCWSAKTSRGPSEALCLSLSVALSSLSCKY